MDLQLIDEAVVGLGFVAVDQSHERPVGPGAAMVAQRGVELVLLDAAVAQIWQERRDLAAAGRGALREDPEQSLEKPGTPFPENLGDPARRDHAGSRILLGVGDDHAHRLPADVPDRRAAEPPRDLPRSGRLELNEPSQRRAHELALDGVPRGQIFRETRGDEPFA